MDLEKDGSELILVYTSALLPSVGSSDHSDPDPSVVAGVTCNV